MVDPSSVKTVLYITIALISIAGTFMGIGNWTGKRKSDSDSIKELKQVVSKNEEKAKLRLYKKDGQQIYVRAVDFVHCQDTNRAEIKEINNLQQEQAKVLVSVESKLDTILALVKKKVG